MGSGLHCLAGWQSCGSQQRLLHRHGGLHPFGRGRLGGWGLRANTDSYASAEGASRCPTACFSQLLR